jgi:hypothetical protein
MMDHEVIACGSAATGALLRMLPEYATKGHGEGFMHDTAMLLGALGWSAYDGQAEVVTPYFGASGTGQINAVFPVTPQDGARFLPPRPRPPAPTRPSRAFDPRYPPPCPTSSSSTPRNSTPRPTSAPCAAAWPTPCWPSATRPAQVFPPGGTRVLAFPAAHHAVSDGGAAGRAAGGNGDYAFVYLNLRMGAGRAPAVVQAAGEALLGVVKRTSRPVARATSASPCRWTRRALVRRQAQQPAPLVQQDGLIAESEPAHVHPRADRRPGAELDQAEKSRQQVEHFSKRFAGMTIEDGYAVSREWVRQKIAAGRSVRGHKIGLTSRAMQLSSQITEPDYGTLLDDMFFAEGGDIPFERFIAPRVEVELAFILGKLRGPGVTLFDVLDATDWVVPAIEIIDARIEQFDRHSKARARSSTRLPTTRPMPASSPAGARCGPTRWTCAG